MFPSFIFFSTEDWKKCSPISKQHDFSDTPHNQCPLTLQVPREIKSRRSYWRLSSHLMKVTLQNTNSLCLSYFKTSCSSAQDTTLRKTYIVQPKTIKQQHEFSIQEWTALISSFLFSTFRSGLGFLFWEHDLFMTNCRALQCGIISGNFGGGFPAPFLF